MPPSEELETKLKDCDPDVQQFIAQLKAENLKAQTRIAKLEAKNLTNENKITALEKELSRYIEAFTHKNSEIPTPSYEDYFRLLAEAEAQAKQKGA